MQAVFIIKNLTRDERPESAAVPENIVNVQADYGEDNRGKAHYPEIVGSGHDVGFKGF